MELITSRVEVVQSGRQVVTFSVMGVHRLYMGMLVTVRSVTEAGVPGVVTSTMRTPLTAMRTPFIAMGTPLTVMGTAVRTPLTIWRRIMPSIFSIVAIIPAISMAMAVPSLWEIVVMLIEPS
jgi:hypothetical protein